LRDRDAKRQREIDAVEQCETARQQDRETRGKHERARDPQRVRRKSIYRSLLSVDRSLLSVDRSLLKENTRDRRAE